MSGSGAARTFSVVFNSVVVVVDVVLVVVGFSIAFLVVKVVVSSVGFGFRGAAKGLSG